LASLVSLHLGTDSALDSLLNTTGKLSQSATNVTGSDNSEPICLISKALISDAECQKTLNTSNVFRSFLENSEQEISESINERLGYSIGILYSQFGEPSVARQYEGLSQRLSQVSNTAEALIERRNAANKDRYKAWARFVSLCLLSFAFPLRVTKSILDFKNAGGV
tara:strand:+ start:143 stop:640 length:498 start_codon:yes stop_codon:yes gene_type:complete